MFERLRVKEHMDVADANGEHVGTVDKILDDRIVLVPSDNDDDLMHYLYVDSIGKIDDNRIYLKQGTHILVGV